MHISRTSSKFHPQIAPLLKEKQTPKWMRAVTKGPKHGKKLTAFLRILSRRAQTLSKISKKIELQKPSTEIQKAFDLDLQNANVTLSAKKNVLIKNILPKAKKLTLYSKQAYLDHAKILFDTFLTKSGMREKSLFPAIKFTALMIAIKVNEEFDGTIGNSYVVETLTDHNIPDLTIKKLNSMERVFLKTVDYKLFLTNKR